MFFREKERPPRLCDATSETKHSGDIFSPRTSKRSTIARALGILKDQPSTPKRSITDLPTELLAPILNDVALTELSLTCRRFREILKLRRFAKCNIRLDNTTNSGYYVYGYRLENVPEKYQAYRHSGGCVRLVLPVISKNGRF
ncbi:hypothetical protein AA313_de0206837 [Arthrobotrys entomopaga]|nr:hypothetical protein AA313_de0206837 [Arthrobotrys entomopaga]